MKVAVILSGCGVRDGSEIHEAVCLALSLDMAGHTVNFFAPDKPQAAVINGVSGVRMAETRNVLIESSRIARGKIAPLSALVCKNFDAILLPGGMGAVTNLCNFTERKTECTVDAALAEILNEANRTKRILGFMCIAPVIAAALFKGVKITLGQNCDVSRACEAMGARHVECRANEACTDEDMCIVSVPAYMEATSVTECFESARALVAAVEALHKRTS